MTKKPIKKILTYFVKDNLILESDYIYSTSHSFFLSNFLSNEDSTVLSILKKNSDFIFQ